MKKRTVKEVEKELGESAEDVANKLRSEGVKGFRKDPRFCPIAIHFEQHCSLWPGADFQPGAILYHDAQIMDYHFGQPVTEFMKRFDAGGFADLAFAEVGHPPDAAK